MNNYWFLFSSLKRSSRIFHRGWSKLFYWFCKCSKYQCEFTFLISLTIFKDEKRPPNNRDDEKLAIRIYMFVFKKISVQITLRRILSRVRGKIAWKPFVVFIIFTTHSTRVGYDTRSIFKRSLTGFNSEFSFS